jgi:general secretion pathway protein H
MLFPPRGFTLIEMLVVMVIIGLFVGLVSAIVQPSDRTLLRVEAERLAQLLGLAATDSRLTGKSIAWTANGSGYRFWRYSTDTDWSEIRDVDSLRPRTLPSGIKIEALRVENSLPKEIMRLEFASNGPTLAFVIDMSYGGARASVEGSPIGEVRIRPDEGKTNGETVTR